MNEPRPDYDQRRLHELASAVMDGVAASEQKQELTGLLRGSSAARDEYLTFVDLHAVLSAELSGALSEDRVDRQADSVPSIRPVSRRSYYKPFMAGVAAMAVCLLCLLISFQLTGRNARSEPFATVVQATSAEWESGVLEEGDRCGTRTLRLRAGFVQLMLDNGVEVTLQGPAEFELFSQVNTVLRSGTLTATAPPGAEGFTVNTPFATVVDHGTSFGIDIGDNGISNVSVFDGKVEVTAHDTGGGHLLTEGKAVRVGADQQIEEVAFSSAPYEKIWPVSSGIAGSSEVFKFTPPWPRQLRFIRSDTAVFVANEGGATTLEKPLRVNISEPGEVSSVASLSPAELLSGREVRSFILHYYPQEIRRPHRASRISGSITFSKPVLGLVVLHEELHASSRLFSERAAGEAHPRRQLELSGGADSDVITLSPDRRTVHVDLTSPRRTSDLVRVIVDASHPGVSRQDK